MANIETLHQRASKACEDGDCERAVELYKEIIKQEPADEIAYHQLMDLYYEKNRVEYYLTRAGLNIIQGKYEHAINDCKKAIGVEPTALLPHMQLAKLYVVTKRNLKAIDEFNKVLELDHSIASAYSDLIDIYLLEQSPESALGVAKAAVKNFPENKDFKDILARIHFDLNDYKSALDTVENKMLKIKILLQDEQNEEAKKLLDEAENSVKKDEKHIYYSLLAQYFYNTKKYQDALGAISELEAANKPSPLSFQMKALVYEGLEDEFSAHLNWGFCEKLQGKAEEAIVQFQSAYNLNPQNKDVAIELAKLYEQTGENFVAIEFWQKIYEIDGDARAKNILADFYYKQGDLRMAEKYGRVIEKKEAAQKEYAQSMEEDEGLLNKIINFFSKK